MATALVTAEDVNVVIVDWRGGSLPLYSQAAANTRLVGMEVARMVEVSVSEITIQCQTTRRSILGSFFTLK